MNTPTNYTRSDEFLAEAIKAPSRIAAYVLRDLLTELQERRATGPKSDTQTEAEDAAELAGNLQSAVGQAEPEPKPGRLVCPRCGSADLGSLETSSTEYSIRLDRDEAGNITTDYTGLWTKTYDEGTEYAGDLWCNGTAGCGQLTEADLITEAEWRREQDPANDGALDARMESES